MLDKPLKGDRHLLDNVVADLALGQGLDFALQLRLRHSLGFSVELKYIGICLANSLGEDLSSLGLIKKSKVAISWSAISGKEPDRLEHVDDQTVSAASRHLRNELRKGTYVRLAATPRVLQASQERGAKVSSRSSPHFAFIKFYEGVLGFSRFNSENL